MRGSEFGKQIGKSLQEKRKAAGYRSAREFADHMGMNVSTYTEYEQGRSMFNYEQAWRFADELGCTLDALGGREFHAGVDAGMTRDESLLVDCYRASTPERRRSLMVSARDAAAMSGEVAERGVDAAGEVA